MKLRFNWAAAGALLGVLGLLDSLVFSQPSMRGASSGMEWVLNALVLVAAFLAGRRAKAEGRRPLWRGALVGALYGGIGGLGAFFIHVTPAQIAAQIQNAGGAAASVSPARIAAIDNSFTIHILAWGVALILFGLLGLVSGVIGGAVARRGGGTDGV